MWQKRHQKNAHEYYYYNMTAEQVSYNNDHLLNAVQITLCCANSSVLFGASVVF